jgi:hypothetical protein
MLKSAGTLQCRVPEESKSSGMWHSVTGQVACDVSKDHSVFVFRGKQSKKNSLTTRCHIADKLTTWCHIADKLTTRRHIADKLNLQLYDCIQEQQTHVVNIPHSSNSCKHHVVHVPCCLDPAQR